MQKLSFYFLCFHCYTIIFLVLNNFTKKKYIWIYFDGHISYIIIYIYMFIYIYIYFYIKNFLLGYVYENRNVYCI